MQNKEQLLILPTLGLTVVIALLGASGAAFGVVRPAGDRVVDTPGSKLDFVVVEVNGTTRLIHPDEELLVVKGDKVIFKEAILTDRQSAVANLNVIGFESAHAKRKGEDRGYVIDTGTDLEKAWSVGKTGEVYRVKAFTGTRQHGEVYLRLLSPQLSYAVLSINTQPAVWRDGEMVHVKASDKFKVEKVVTNVNDDDASVTYQMIPTAAPEELPGIKFFELRFLRGRDVFARIPVQVEGS